jgi:hypothetical protein
VKDYQLGKRIWIAFWIVMVVAIIVLIYGVTNSG